MPVIEPYPDEVTQHGPRTARYEVEEIEYPTDIGTPYKDGGTDYNLKADTVTRRFTLDYKTKGFVTETEAAILDAHWEQAKGRTYGFDFYDKKSGTVYTDVHYESFEKGHGEKHIIQFRMVKLIKRP